MNFEITTASTRNATPKSYVTTYEAARMLGVTLRTVQVWSNAGVLDCWKTEGGHRRILRASVERLLVGRRDPVEGVAVDVVSRGDRPREALRILIVEDEPGLLRQYRLRLARWPMAPEVSVATNGIEGLVLLGSERPHLLIADLSMPEMDGIQMLRTLRTMKQIDSTEIVVVTGLDPGDVAERGGVPAGIPVLPKPIPFDQLQALAERLAVQCGCRGGATEEPFQASETRADAVR